MKRTLAALGLAAALLPSAACGGPEEILGNAANAAACTAAQQAVAPIKAQAQSAVDQLGIDPAGARGELQVLRAAVDAAAVTAGGELRQSLDRVSSGLGTLLDQAGAAARGTVDQPAVNQAQAELTTAVDEVTRIC